jgi:uncharacterized protein (TIGR02246 family)
VTPRKSLAPRSRNLFASVFTNDADFINIRAHELRGRRAIAEHHPTLFATIYKGSTARVERVLIRLIRPDVATIEQTTVVEFEGADRRAHMLAVAVEGPDGWAIQAVHNMLPLEG